MILVARVKIKEDDKKTLYLAEHMRVEFDILTISDY